MKGISILGSTGSVGTNVLRVVDAFPGRFRVVGLAGGANVERLAEQVARYRPRTISVASPESRDAIARLVDLSDVRVGVGEQGMVAVATEGAARIVVASAVGAVGLVPTYRALEAGKDVALANKETLVMAGELMLAQSRAGGGRLLPIDSEHCALHQCLDGRRPEEVRRLVLTASGGPFRGRPRNTFNGITPEEALNHPTWSMGRKITIDSATLMNKGLEVIEARWLFDVGPERVEVVVHPQSIVHSLVEFRDTSVIAQLGLPDMRVPIAVALAHPERLPLALPRLDLAAVGRLDFETPDTKRFPCLDLAYQALRGDEAAPAVLNAANEVAVEAFLAGAMAFPAIAAANGAVLEAFERTEAGGALRDLDDVIAADGWARARAREWLAAHANAGGSA